MTQKDRDVHVKPVKDAAAGEEMGSAPLQTAANQRKEKRRAAFHFLEMQPAKLGELGTFIASLTVSPSAPKPQPLSLSFV